MTSRRKDLAISLDYRTTRTDRSASKTENWRRGRSRVEKSELIRDALFRAAAEVVGEVGYADASISLITQKAGVAQGTFYNYFESRQDILDKLLPTLGDKMQAHIRECAQQGRDFAELEERSFRGFFSFLRETPHFFRILNEAESFAPVGHKQHFESVATRYLQFLQRSHRNGEFPAYREEELEVIVFILMAARSYLALRYVYREGREGSIPDWVVDTYMKFVLYGLEGAPVSAKKHKTAKKMKAATSS